MEKRGRPAGSKIRQNIVEILYLRGKSYGYDLYKDYCAIYPKVSLRVIYYHLAKGVSRSEFEMDTVKEEQGKYSWGTTAEKKYYGLGKAASPKVDLKAKAYFAKKR